MFQEPFIASCNGKAFDKSFTSVPASAPVNTSLLVVVMSSEPIRSASKSPRFAVSAKSAGMKR